MQHLNLSVFWFCFVFYFSPPPVACLPSFSSSNYFHFPRGLTVLFHHLALPTSHHPLWQWDSSIAQSLSLSSLKRFESLLQDDNNFLVFCRNIWYIFDNFHYVQRGRCSEQTRCDNWNINNCSIGQHQVEGDLAVCEPAWGTVTNNAYFAVNFQSHIFLCRKYQPT